MLPETETSFSSVTDTGKLSQNGKTESPVSQADFEDDGIYSDRRLKPKCSLVQPTGSPRPNTVSSLGVWEVSLHLKVPSAGLMSVCVISEESCSESAIKGFQTGDPLVSRSRGAPCAPERGQGCYCAKRQKQSPPDRCSANRVTPSGLRVRYPLHCPLGGKGVKGQEDRAQLLAGQMESQVWGVCFTKGNMGRDKLQKK